MSDAKRENVLKQLAELEDMPTADLKAKWKDLYGKEPPRFNRQLLVKQLAYRIQELAYGGLDEQTKKRMDKLLEEEGYDAIGRKISKKKKGIVPGTVLVRDWQGERHEVIVREDGVFDYRDMPYRSLSAVARKITGTRWNGPAFFGLRGKGISREAARG